VCATIKKKIGAKGLKGREFQDLDNIPEELRRQMEEYMFLSIRGDSIQ
jgi:hypothetical protein